MKELQALLSQEDFAGKLDPPDGVLCFSNGVYDFSCSSFRPGRASDFAFRCTGYDFPQDISALAPIKEEVLSWLRQAHDPEQAQYLLHAIASSLSGSPKFEQFWVWVGSGANMKGVTVTLVKGALGGYFSEVPVRMLTDAQLSATSASPNPALLNLRGVRCVVANEPEPGKTFSVGRLKSWSGRDAISTRGLHKGTVVEFVPQFSIHCACNSVPALSSGSADNAIRRRMRIIPFTRRFVSKPKPDKPEECLKDPNVKDKVSNSLAHKQAMVLLLLEAWQSLKGSKKLTEPGQVQEATSKYFQQSKTRKQR